MLFYKIEGTPMNHGAESEPTRHAQRVAARRIAVKSNEFNEKSRHGSYFFAVNVTDTIATIGVIAERRAEVDKTLPAYLNHIECELTDVVKTEITFSSMQHLLGVADRQGYISDDDVMEK